MSPNPRPVAECAAAQMPAPSADWLASAEVFASAAPTIDWEGLLSSKVPFLIWAPEDRGIIANLHANGIRSLPYAMFYHAPAIGTFQGIDFRRKQYLFELDANGAMRRSVFWTRTAFSDTYAVCPNTEEFQDAAVRWAERTMALAADGLFVDTVVRRQPCHGPQFGKHQHMFPSQDAAYAALLGRIRDVVHSHGKDKVLLGNSGDPTRLAHEFEDKLDGDMAESYVLSWAWKDRGGDWQARWQPMATDFERLRHRGKKVLALGYAGHTAFGVREDSFFSYASARLAGAAWSNGRPLGDPDSSVLYRIRLGEELGPSVEKGGVVARPFEHGFVALNSNTSTRLAFPLRGFSSEKHLIDLAGSRAKGWTPDGSNMDQQTVETAHSGIRSIGIRHSNATTTLVFQRIPIDANATGTLILQAWSKAEAVQGATGCDQSVYLDVQHVDPAKRQAECLSFASGTHGWTHKSVEVAITAPLATAQIVLVFRNGTGQVWFDDVDLRLRNGSGSERSLVANGGFEECDNLSRVLDLAGPDPAVDVPANSGRVYLYAPALGTRDQ